MKVSKYYKNILLVVILSVGLSIFGSCDEKYDYNDDYKAIPKTEVCKNLVERTELFAQIYTDETYKVVDGVQATEIRYLSMKGHAMKIFIFEVDLENPNISIAASTPNNLPLFRRQQMTRQAEAADAPGNVVWGGVNADFFNMQTGVPRGPLHKNGVAIKSTFDSGERSFFYITKDKKARIGHSTEYPAVNASGVIKEAVGGSLILVKDGIVIKHTDTTIEPRTCIGVSENETKVYILVADGRNYTYSNGMLYEELGLCLKALGAHNAINLDGGGSSTFFIRTTPEFTDGRFQIRNWPTDNGGAERAVANGLIIISK